MKSIDSGVGGNMHGGTPVFGLNNNSSGQTTFHENSNNSIAVLNSKESANLLSESSILV